ncbi:MAG TPA: hypothetical protein VFS71_05835 [Flavobacterium sp.]|uniref:hypothetical protein n=1 Tax=Flavobacterium sp. TaxID=239 RepID=UPI002DB90557|nr:hypothetical protein [Flavobacterium sp.]HEU4789185.1 hypothetical protein [Flavobacterium sp.]
MIRFFLFFSMLFCFVSNAQNETRYFISLENSANKKIESGFYIEKIYDGRQIKDNVGTVQRSVFNKKVLAVLEKPLTEELQNYLTICFPKEEGKKGLSIRVNEFYVSEHTTDNLETGYATVVFDFIEKIEGVEYIVGSFSSTISENSFDVTSGHEQRLIKAINTCFVEYKNRNKKAELKIVFDPSMKMEKDLIPIYNKGIYLNYVDVFYGSPNTLDNYTVTKYKDKYCLLNNITGKVESGFYGFNDGQNIYINLFHYSTVKVYAKTEIMGMYYFIDEVVSNVFDYSELREKFGLTVMFLFPDLTEPKLPLLIDRFTGSPVFLTNSYMVNLLSPNTLLVKEYKRTQRTSEDKKRMYKKYFGLI